MPAELWAPGACFTRATKGRVGKLFWHSERGRLVMLLEAKQLLLDPRNVREDYKLLKRLVKMEDYAKDSIGTAYYSTMEWKQVNYWQMFHDPRRKQSKRHLLDVLYIKYLDDEQFNEEVYSIRNDPFYHGQFIL